MSWRICTAVVFPQTTLICQKIPTAGARCDAAQIFDLIRGIYVKTVAEQSTLIRYECDALQLTAREKRVSRDTLFEKIFYNNISY